MSSPLLKPTHQTSNPASSLSQDEAHALLRQLIEHSWQRLKPECDDPINMLYDDLEASEWTMGWAPKDNTLYLLLWKKESWQSQPTWYLYINGIPAFQCNEDSFSKNAKLCQELLESPELPSLSIPDFLNRITDYHIPFEQREHSLSLLSETLKGHPKLWNTFKQPFYQYMAKGLNENNWPTLDLLKIHRLEQKHLLLQGLKEWTLSGLIDSLDEKRLLNRLLNQIHYQYEALGKIITPLAKPQYEKAYQNFQKIISQGFWHIQLINKPFKETSLHSSFPSVTP